MVLKKIGTKGVGVKKKRLRLENARVTRVAKKFGLPGNLGFMQIAAEIARINNIALPATREQAKAIIHSQPEYGIVFEAPKKKPGRKNYAASDAFLESYEWRRVRMVVLKRDGARCGCCGATPADGVRMHVDHIKPRRLALDLNNLQVLCEVCNHGKGNWDQTDWRTGEAANDSPEMQHIRSIILEGERGR
jgi:hypothetical protein